MKKGGAMKRLRWFFLAFAAVFLAGCKLGGASTCGETDKDCQRKAMNTHPIRLAKAWSSELEKPVSQRVDIASGSLIEYITLDNQLNGFSERPRVPKLEAGFLADFQAAFNDLPPEVLKVVGNRLVGIRFVSNLGGSGYTDQVYDSNGDVVGAFVVFDSDVLKSMSANQWATWKERTPFKAEQGYSLEAQIETAELDTRKNALQYILLHELGHVISIGRNIHPNWNKSVQQQAASAERFPFFETTWKFDPAGSFVASKFDSNFPQRKDVVYYGKARISGSSMGQTYASLEQTSFPTLYAATKPGDDFAEAFANYVHVVLMHRPWQINLLKDGKVIKTVKTCWGQLRCAEKRMLIEELFGTR
jgi:hypothetical protein